MCYESLVIPYYRGTDQFHLTVVNGTRGDKEKVIATNTSHKCGNQNYEILELL